MTPPPKPSRRWAAHFFIGADLFAWLRLCADGRFRFGLPQLHLAPLGVATGVFHTFLRYAQHHLYGDRIRATRVAHPPLFIVGHWRTGTTWLHELLILDPNHGYATTLDCLDPTHHLLTAWANRRFLTFLVPDKRPMDNVRMGWETPQEDEFALVMLGAPSPYRTIAFPNRGPLDSAALDLDGLPKWQRANWERIFCRFVQTLTFRDPRRLILKSPPHTCRIPTLLKLFPDAKFLHVVRDPLAVFPSTVNLWKALYRTQGLQVPTYAGLEEQVYQTFLHVYDRLDGTRGLIPAGQFHEVRYEDLLADPVGQLERAYRALGLGDFETVRPRVESHLKANARFEPNRFDLPDETRREVLRRWGRVRERYGYQ